MSSKKWSVTFTNSKNQILNSNQNFVKGNEWLHSNETFKVKDISKSIKISGEFQSVGKEDSKIYFVLTPITNKKIKIHQWITERKDYSFLETDILYSYCYKRYNDNEFTILSAENQGFTIKEDGNQIKTEFSLDYNKSIFIFIDGDTSKLPDHVLLYSHSDLHSLEEKYGIIKKSSDRFISLNVDISNTGLLNEIIPGKTKIIRSSKGSKFINCCENLSGGVANNEKMEIYEGKVQGEGELGKYRKDKLPMGTKKVKVSILFNYNQSEKAICLFNKIEIEGEGIEKEGLEREEFQDEQPSLNGLLFEL